MRLAIADEPNLAQFILDDNTAADVAGFFFQAEDGIRDVAVTGVQTCALPISLGRYMLEMKSARCSRCASSQACSVQAWRGSRSWRRFAPPAARSAEPSPGAKIHRDRKSVV